MHPRQNPSYAYVINEIVTTPPLSTSHVEMYAFAAKLHLIV